MGKFKFNGKSSEDFGLVVQTPPTYEYPDRDLTVTHIPGRNGDIILDNNCFRNVQRTYSVGTKYFQPNGYYENFSEVLTWLNSARGKYARLEDSYDPDVYRLASFQMSGSFIDYYGKGGATTVTFVCKPQRFLKSGEEETEYIGDTITIENVNGYTAKPEIKLYDIDVDFGVVLMMSVINCFGEAVSNVTITDYTGSLVLDSEDETATDLDGEDANDYIGLNSLPFPEFQSGANTIVLAEYNAEATTVNSYYTILSNNQYACLSEYKTYAALEQTAQSKIFVKSYNALIRSKQESYPANSVQSYISSIAEVYTFDSFNTLLNNYGKQYTFTGSIDENSSSKPSWMAFETRGEHDELIAAIAAVTGFFIVSGEDKRIRFITEGTPISESLKPGAINTITYFPAVANLPQSQSHAQNPPSYSGANYEIDIGYSDIPSWLDYVIVYDADGDFKGSPNKLIFKRSASTDGQGYYWTDKTWLFGKAQWKYCEASIYLSELELVSLNWSTSKKAFVAMTGLSTSTTATFTYKYLKATPLSLPDYVDITTTTVDDRGVETVTTDKKVHFSITDAGTTLESIIVKPKDTGYYSYQIGEGDPQPWVHITSDPSSHIIIANLSGTKNFGIFYLTEPPNYKNEEDWPGWLSPYPLCDGDEEDLLTAEKIWFQVLANSYYRISAGPDDDTPQSRDSWTHLDANDTLADIMSSKTVNDAMYVYKLDALVDPFDYNRSYTINAGTPSATPPDWLVVELTPSELTTEDTPETIKFKAGTDGYYKWDSNESWLYKHAGEELFEIGGKDDCTIYYLQSLPEYSESDFSVQSMFELFNIEIVQSPNPGNPKEIHFNVASTGYYRANNSTSWKYLNEGDTLLSAKVGDAIQLYHLSPTNSDLSNLKTTIKPRWWKL